MDKSTAWSCTITNLAALPGLGSLAAGRRIGYAQAAVALAGFGLSLLWMGLFIRDWRAQGELPIGWRPTLWVGITGIGLFGAGWLWALVTSRSLLREARRTEVPEAVPVPEGVRGEATDETGPSTPPRL